MNYRHAFHAGNFADLMKHLALMSVLEWLAARERPFTLVDTHAGIGLYDLAGDEARRTGEANGGIETLLTRQVEAPPALKRFIGLVKELRARAQGKRLYPGSPWLVQHFLREGDRASFCEMHPEDAKTLLRMLGSDRRVNVKAAADGYDILARLLAGRHTVDAVLIDPPFEKSDDYERMEQALMQLADRQPQAVALLWYPIKDRNDVWRMQDGLERTAGPALLDVEFLIEGEPDIRRFAGCGLTIKNPPPGLAGMLEAELPALLSLLGHDRGTARVSWITPPADR
jgi:23S rRNA (adenine2030-N6)-methyltransferase